MSLLLALLDRSERAALMVHAGIVPLVTQILADNLDVDDVVTSDSSVPVGAVRPDDNSRTNSSVPEQGLGGTHVDTEQAFSSDSDVDDERRTGSAQSPAQGTQRSLMARARTFVRMGRKGMTRPGASRGQLDADTNTNADADPGVQAGGGV